MLWWLAHNAVTAGLLAGLVLLVCRLARPRPAVQHALWLLVLVKLLSPAWLSRPRPWPEVEEPFAAAPVEAATTPIVKVFIPPAKPQQVVAGSPDPATRPTEGLPSVPKSGDLRSKDVARSGDRATTGSP